MRLLEIWYSITAFFNPLPLCTMLCWLEIMGTGVQYLWRPAEWGISLLHELSKIFVSDPASIQISFYIYPWMCSSKRVLRFQYAINSINLSKKLLKRNVIYFWSKENNRPNKSPKLMTSKANKSPFTFACNTTKFVSKHTIHKCKTQT